MLEWCYLAGGRFPEGVTVCLHAHLPHISMHMTFTTVITHKLCSSTTPHRADTQGMPAGVHCITCSVSYASHANTIIRDLFLFLLPSVYFFLPFFSPLPCGCHSFFSFLKKKSSITTTAGMTH